VRAERPAARPGMRPVLQATTTTSQSRARQDVRSPRRSAGGLYGP
jgi:hypothetical protein